MMGLQSYMKEAAPFAAMIFIETGEVGMTTLTKAAMNKGMSNFVYVVYYNALGVLILFPYFLFQKHRNKPPPLTLALLWRFFLLGLLGKSLVMFGYVGIDYSSPTLAAALGNLTPIFTFLLAIIFRMEKIEIRSATTGAKAVGTVVVVGGALIVTLYRGPAIAFAKLLYNHSNQWKLGSLYSNWMLGSLYLAIGYVFGAAWSIAQAATVKEYPEQATVIFYYCLFGTMQCAVVSLLIERNPNTWILSPGIGIAAIVYSAIFGTAIRYCVITWCLNEKGPLFVSLFKPLGMIVSLVGGIIFLGDTLYLGSVVGAIVIALGFYTVMWGQAKEKDIIVPKVCVLESSTETTPLLLGTRDV